MKFLKRTITRDQSRDTGMALVLLLLIAAATRKREVYLLAAIAFQAVDMIWPAVYKPLAVLWLGLSDLLGAIASKICMAIVFLLVVTPTALLRRISGKDTLKLRAFKTGKDSVMEDRNHLFVAQDIEKPY